MLIGSQTAAEEAKRSLNRLRIEGHPGVAAASADGYAGVPVLVTRIDASGQDYYLVPWQDEQGINVIVQVDAQSGMMSSVVALSTPLARLTISPEDARHIATVTLGVRVIGEPSLVWRACRESASTFQPLYQVPIEGGDVFVGMDSSAYRSLTPFGKGG